MLCENCKKNVATVHLTEIHSGRKKERHLCEECARSMNLPHQPPLYLAEMLSSFIEKTGAPEDTEEEGGKTCSECGMTFGEFKNKGRLGCEHDYVVFREEFKKILKRIHGSDRYVGKVPRGYREDDVRLNELFRLKERMKKAVAAEAYEEAARIRDRLKELERLMGEGGEEPVEEQD